MADWNLWHGCHKISEGCRNCYVYRADARHGRDPSVVRKTSKFDMPVKKDRKGNYKILPGENVYTCFTSDFFVEDADDWRNDAWNMMKIRSDLEFFLITKRIHRFMQCIPDDWNDGYDNVTICCTVENQLMADFRLPIYKKAPIKHKIIVCEPLLSRIYIEDYLDGIEEVVAGGESGSQARLCDFDWIMDLRQQCIRKNVRFIFKQTGAKLKKDGKIYRIERKYQHTQAKKANINYIP